MQKIRDQINIPIFLAIGVNSKNVRKVIKHAQPFGVDLYSSVRTNGKPDENKLNLFFHTIQSIHYNQSSI
jgi:phosphoribosylanthranilate isomerase